MPSRKPLAPRRSFQTQKKQTRLGFSSLPSSSPAKDKYDPAIRERLANVRYNGSSPIRIGAQLTEPAETALPTPQPSSQPAKTMPSVSSSSLSDVPRSPQLPATVTPATESKDEDEVILPSAKRRRMESHTTPLRRSGRLCSSPVARPKLSSSGSDESFAGVEVPSPRRGRDLGEIASPETSGDEAEVLLSRPSQRNRRVLVKDTYYNKPWSEEKFRRDDFVADDGEVEYISSDEDVKTKPNIDKKRSRKRAERRSREEQEELEADLEDLRDSDVEDSARKRRTRGGPITTKRDEAREHLDLLKRRRAGERVPRICDSDEEAEEEDDVQDLNLIGQPSQDLSDDGSAHSSVDTEPDIEETSEVEDEDTFIEDDTSGRRGRPNPDIPLEFTHFASSKPSELFIHVVEWLVKNKIAPAFSRNDDIYRLAMNKVDDQVKAQAGSRLISSAWNATFKYTILARPDISINLLPGEDDDHIKTCDACNKKNRPARYDFVLSGDAYAVDTLEPVNDSDDEQDSFDDNASRDAAGHTLAGREHHFFLGSHCAANAQMGHKLVHWKYHLNEVVLEFLEEHGILLADAIVSRDKLNNKKREREAEAIIDSMEETGKIAELWRDFKNDLNDARLGMEGYEKRGGRSKGRIGVVQSRVGNVVGEWRDDKFRRKIVPLSDDSE